MPSTDRQKCNCSVIIKESHVSRTEGIEFGSYTFLQGTFRSGIFQKWL